MRLLSPPTAWRWAAPPALVIVLAIVGLLQWIPRASAVESAAGETGPVSANLPGRIIFGRAGDIWALSNGHVDPITREGGWEQPEVSPDGSKIAAIAMYGSYTDLYVMDSDGTGQRALTRDRHVPLDDSDWAFHPQWSPDGGTIGFVTDRSSFYPMLWRINADGTGLRQVTVPAHGLDAIDSFAWSPDGSTIAATRFLGNQSQIFVMDIARPSAGKAATNAERGAFDPSWSPDGRYLTYVTREATKNVVWVLDLQNADHAIQVAEAESARSPVWSPYGNAIAYIGMANGAFEIYSVDVAVGGPDLVNAGRSTQLTVQFGVDSVSGLSWTAS